MPKQALFYLMLVIMLIAGCSGQDNSAAGKPEEPVELTVSAAASLSDSLKEIQADYEKSHTGVKLTFNFGASGSLQQQIEQGAPADLFLSAGTKQMTALVNQQLIDSDQQTSLLANELVVVVPADRKDSFPLHALDGLTGSEIKKLAVGEPETVPAGGYAKDALTYYKLWETVQPKIVFAKDVRQVLNYVETGNAEAGIVYKTDALSSTKVQTAFALDPVSYKPIEYPAGIVKATKHMDEAREFYRYLQSKPAQDIFLKYGFTLPKGK